MGQLFGLILPVFISWYPGSYRLWQRTREGRVFLLRWVQLCCTWHILRPPWQPSPWQIWFSGMLLYLGEWSMQVYGPDQFKQDNLPYTKPIWGNKIPLYLKPHAAFPFLICMRPLQENCSRPNFSRSSDLDISHKVYNFGYFSFHFDENRRPRKETASSVLIQ